MKNIESNINTYLLRLKFNPKLKGFKYLREAVKVAVNHKSGCFVLKRDIYPHVCERFKLKPANLERDIANAIDNAFLSISIEDLEEYFGNTINSMTGKPTVKELISAARMSMLFM